MSYILCPAIERADSAADETGSPMAGCSVGEPVLVGARRVLSLDRV